MIQYIITIMPGRPKEGRKSQVYKRMMANLAKGIKEVKKEDSKEEKPKQEKKKESKVEKVKRAFKKE